MALPDGQRGEVISVVQRRRRWTTEEKLALVEEAMRPGSSVAGVADRHSMSRSLLFEWRRQAREGTMPGLVRTESEVPPTLVPVRVFAALASEAGPPERLMIDSTHLKAHRTAASLLKKGLLPAASGEPRAA